MTSFPLWILAYLGKQVSLKVEFVGPCETYAVGAVGVLRGIECDPGHPVYVTVALDAADDSYLENFALDEIRPVADQVHFSIDLEAGALTVR